MLPSGIAFTQQQATMMSAIHLFPGWKPFVDALRHLALQSQDRVMSPYVRPEDAQFERGFVAALEEVVNLVEDVIPTQCATLLEEARGNGSSEGSGDQSQSAQ